MSNELVELLRPLVRPSTRMALSQTDTDLPLDVTKVGGTPYLAPNEEWPKCSESCFPTTFVCQIDLSATASGPVGAVRFVQFFACYQCGRHHFITRSALPARREPIEVPEARAFVRPCRVQLEPVPSLPDWDTIGQFAPAASDLAVAMDDEPWAAYQRAAAELGVEFELRSSVGGYPKWLQGNQWPDGKTFVAQLDSASEAELVWGDHGLVYLFANSDGSDLSSIDESL
jgi:uncharacterized protein YwqG